MNDTKVKRSGLTIHRYHYHYTDEVQCMYFNSNLRKLREDHHLTQKALADIIKVTRPTIAGYESKNHQPDYEKLLILSDYFHISIDDLLRKDLNAPKTGSYMPSVREQDFQYFERHYNYLSEASVKTLFNVMDALVRAELYNKEKR